MTGPRWNLRPALRACLIWSTAPGSGLWVGGVPLLDADNSYIRDTLSLYD